MSEQRVCKTCNKPLKDSDVTVCRKCSGRWKRQKPEPRKCVNCGQQFYSYWKRQLQCFDCRAEKLARVSVCLWCREPLRVKKHFCNPMCYTEYGVVQRKIIMGFPLEQVNYELLVLRKSGVNYRGLEKLECVQH